MNYLFITLALLSLCIIIYKVIKSKNKKKSNLAEPPKTNEIKSDIEDHIESDIAMDTAMKDIFDEFSDFDIEYLGKHYDYPVKSFSFIEGEKAILTGFDQESHEYVFIFITGDRKGEEYRVIKINEFDPFPINITKDVETGELIFED